jgi:hypothetical protein
MKPPRFQIAWLMVAVAVAAINFGAIRAMLAPGMGSAGTSLVVGAWPMLNILIIGLLVAHQRPRNRPFLLGFEAFGTMALAFYVLLVISSHDEVVMPYARLALDPINATIGGLPPLVLFSVRMSAGLVLLVGPQLAVALIGGVLSRSFPGTVRIFSPPDRTVA